MSGTLCAVHLVGRPAPKRIQIGASVHVIPSTSYLGVLVEG